VLPALWETLAGSFFLRHGRHLDQVELAAGLERGGPILVWWRLKPGAPKSLTKTLTTLSLPGAATEIMVNEEVQGHKPDDASAGVLVLDHHGLELRARPGVFFQANLDLNPRLVDLVLDSVRGDGPVLDLFSGLGNFSLPLAASGRSVTGVENSPAAVANARVNAQAAGPAGVDLMEADVAEAFDYLEPGRFETVVLDPPRRGAPRVADQVARLAPARIVYVSCNPRFLARDMVALEKSGYGLRSLRPMDMFPRTVHLEVVAVLDR
ncbi:MAG: methyltransferase, partial [Proteobacteria bacterium]|nr:methyltransferase [Pseudomonadota bacterium]